MKGDGERGRGIKDWDWADGYCIDTYKCCGGETVQ
jgi:hypothetical protein